MSFRSYFTAEARLRRQIRREAYVSCGGDTVSHWSGLDFEVCSREGCEMPSGGPCAAAVESDERYAQGCRAVGLRA